MNINRRKFFLGLSAASFATIPAMPLPFLFFGRYVLYADGVTDDTKSIQAMIDGKDVWYNGRIVHYLPRGRSVITDTLHITPDSYGLHGSGNYESFLVGDGTLNPAIKVELNAPMPSLISFYRHHTAVALLQTA